MQRFLHIMSTGLGASGKDFSYIILINIFRFSLDFVAVVFSPCLVTYLSGHKRAHLELCVLHCAAQTPQLSVLLKADLVAALL